MAVNVSVKSGRTKKDSNWNKITFLRKYEEYWACFAAASKNYSTYMYAD